MASHCFDEHTAGDLARGALAPTLADALLTHAEQCLACSERLARARAHLAASDEAPTAPIGEGFVPLPLGAPLEETSEDVDLPAGTSIGRYLILAVLGKGGMGTVYSAYDPQLERKVAIKLVRPDQGEGSGPSSGQKRLLREAQAMARLSHPSVLPIFDVGLHQDSVFLAMEMVDGADARKWLREKPRGCAEILRVFLAAGRGLAATHAAGLVHRDFKPENVLIGKDGRVHVADLGVARAEFDPAASGAPAEPGARSTPSGSFAVQLTQQGALVGTVTYMSPEQLQGKSATARSDQFNFCVSLWSALFGRRPFAGDTPEQLLAAIVRQDFAPTPEGAKVPRRIQRILQRGLAPGPDDRYPSMDALLDELARDPRVAGRRVLIAASIALALGALGLLASGRLQHQQEFCRERAAQLGGVWNLARQKQIESAFLSSGRPYAADAWQGARRLLDAYAAAWSAMAAETCQAAVIDGTLSAPVYAQRAACLEERRAEMAAIADLFARADGSVVERAGQVAASLPPLSTCADLRALGRRLKPPEPQLRAQVAELETQIQTVRLRAEAGQYSQALALMKPLREAARLTRYAPLEGHADYATGLLQKDLEDLASAERSHYAALLEAQAGGDDETVVRAASALAEIIGLRQERFDEGERWGRLAASTLERVEGDDLLRAEICFRQGKLLYEVTRYPEARRQAELAVDLRTKALGPDALPTADALYLLGEVAMEMGDLELAHRSTASALAIGERVLGERHPVTLSYRLAVASLLYDAGRVQEAEQAVRGLDELIRAAGGSPRSLALLAMVLSGIGLEQGRFADALAHAQQAKDLYGTVDVYNQGAMWGQMGRVQLAMGHAQESVESYTRSVAIIEKIYGPVHQDAAEFQGGLGEALLATGKAREALVVAERAVAAPHLEWQNPANAARARFVLARALWETRRDRVRALVLADEARALFRKTGFRQRQVAEVDAWLSTRAH